MEDRQHRTRVRGRLRWALSVGSLAAILATGVALAAGAGAGTSPATPASPAWGAATGITLPTGGVTGVLYGVGCTSTGFCAAAGDFQKSFTGTALPMVLVRSGGVWRHGVALQLPKSAAATPDAIANDAACASATSCELVGQFHYASNGGKYNNAFISDFSTAGWSRPRSMALPANAASVTQATLNDISCPSAGNCGALGTYVNNKGLLETAAFIEKSGTWARGTEINAPGSVKVQPYGISCPAAGDCVAVGKYKLSNGAFVAWHATATNGVWGTAVQVALPTDGLTGASQQGDFHAVSCTSVGNCLAVGNYRIAPTKHSNAVYSLSETAGVWQTRGLQFIPRPPNGASGASLVPQDNGLACPAGGCVTVGFYSTTTGLVRPLSDAVSGAPATWQPAVEVPPPADTSTSPPATALFRGLSCWSTWSCVGVGSYTNKGGHEQALIATSS